MCDKSGATLAKRSGKDRFRLLLPYEKGASKMPFSQTFCQSQIVSIMNHAYVQIICPEALTLILEASFHIFQFAGAIILIVLPDCADMGFKHNLVYSA